MISLIINKILNKSIQNEILFYKILFLSPFKYNLVEAEYNGGLPAFIKLINTTLSKNYIHNCSGTFLLRLDRNAKISNVTFRTHHIDLDKEKLFQLLESIEYNFTKPAKVMKISVTSYVEVIIKDNTAYSVTISPPNKYDLLYNNHL